MSRIQLQEWKEKYGNCKWTHEDVFGLCNSIEELQSQLNKANELIKTMESLSCNCGIGNQSRQIYHDSDCHKVKAKQYLESIKEDKNV